MSETIDDGVAAPLLHGAPEGSEGAPAAAALASTEWKVRLGFGFALTCLGVVGIVSYQIGRAHV